jgi:hypothetical protein
MTKLVTCCSIGGHELVKLRAIITIEQIRRP